MRHALSVDVEEWFQVGAFERTIDRDQWGFLQSRVVANTEAVMDLFDGAGVKATFFTLGWVAHRHPKLIRQMAERGHEVASHGWDHKRVHQMEPDEFRDDLAKARDALEQAGGVAVTGYRAPNFSIDTRTPWAHSVLAEAGYRYSSSVAPLKHDHYGWAEAPATAHRPLADSDLVELPVGVMRVLGRPIAMGGGFFRLLPGAWTSKAITAGDRPAVFYFHPWEIDPHQPRVRGAPLKSRLRHYARLGAMAGKLDTLACRHRWTRVDEVVADEVRRLG
jgi:polysaccharide deacetylase family protein (PEP-CTERM system associated)